MAMDTPAPCPRDGVLTYKGSNYFRQRLVLATLSSKSVRIIKIRKSDEKPGLREYEAGFVRLLDKLTNGSRIVVNETGTTLFYQPGLLIGGTLTHECSKQRSIGYSLESLLMLAPFMKKSLKITLRGITNGHDDPSVDYYRLCVLPLLNRVIPGNDFELKIRCRGIGLIGTGEVILFCPVVKLMKPVYLVDTGKICRVRGVAYCLQMNPSVANRIVESSRKVLNNYLPDVFVYTDVLKGEKTETSPGFGVTLVAESTTGVMYSTEAHYCASKSTHEFAVPEDIGVSVATSLIEDIFKGGITDSASQVFPLLFMGLLQKDVSKITVREPTNYSIQLLRHLSDFFQLVYKVENKDAMLESDHNNLKSLSRQYVTLSCVGVGLCNFSKGIL